MLDGVKWHWVFWHNQPAKVRVVDNAWKCAMSDSVAVAGRLGGLCNEVAQFRAKLLVDSSHYLAKPTVAKVNVFGFKSKSKEFIEEVPTVVRRSAEGEYPSSEPLLGFPLVCVTWIEIRLDEPIETCETVRQSPGSQEQVGWIRPERPEGKTPKRLEGWFEGD